MKKATIADSLPKAGMLPQIIGLGAGGHAKVLIEILLAAGEHELAGLVDANEALWGGTVLGVPVLGDDTLLPGLREKGVIGFFMGLGSVGDPDARRRLFDQAVGSGLAPITVVHRQAVISASAALGPGTVAMAGAIINADAVVGANVIINTAAVIEHDCVIGDHVHVATGAKLAGAVVVGESAHIGVGAAVRQCVQIGAGAIVGAGAAVISDVAPGLVVGGVPARPIDSQANRLPLAQT